MVYVAPILVDGTPYPAQMWQDALDELARLSAGATPGWTAYTPVWAAATTAPVLGNGTLTGAYRRTSDLVVARLKLVMGSTTTYGAGSWNFSVPLPAAAADMVLGAGHTYDAGVALKPVVTRRLTASTFTVIAGTSGIGELNATLPHAWGTSDEVNLEITYQPA